MAVTDTTKAQDQLLKEKPSGVGSPNDLLEEKPSTAFGEERLLGAQNLVKNYTIAAMGLGLVPLPFIDLAAVMALQIKLVHGLAHHYEVSFKENLTKSLLALLISGAGSLVGFMGLASLVKSIPFLGTLEGMGTMAVTAGSVTYAVGQVFIAHFESGGTLLDFEPKRMRSLFKQEVKKGKGMAAQMKGEPPSSP